MQDPSQAAESLAQVADDVIEDLTGVDTSDGHVTREKADGAELILDRFGSGDRLFVLIHGIGMGRKVFSDLITHLSPHGRVWAFDLPGYGEAAEPRRTPTMEKTADLVAEVLRAHGAHDATVVGHSMGTQVSLELAVRHPDLVSHLVLAAPTVDAAYRRGFRQAARLARDLWGEKLSVFILGGREYLRAGPNLVRKMHSMLVHRPEDVADRVGVPTLVIRGERDRVVPHEWAAEMTARLPEADLVELADRGHQTLITDAEVPARHILTFVGATAP